MRPRPLATYLVILLAVIAAACSVNPKPDTSQLSPTGQRDYQLVQYVKAVNDVSVSAVTANQIGKLSDDHTARILTINKQVLDYIADNPNGTRAQIIAVVRNARDALPAAINDAIGSYIDQVLAIFAEVQ